jgi:hypothetical protein
MSMLVTPQMMNTMAAHVEPAGPGSLTEALYADPVRHYMIPVFFCYALILASLAVELEVARRVARSEVRRQAGFMIAASGVTLFCNALYVSELVELNATVVSLSVSSALLLVGTAREGCSALPAAPGDGGHPMASWSSARPARAL